MRWLHKLVFQLNCLMAILMLVSFILPYLPPSRFPTLSLLSLGVPLLIIINIVFAAYWLIQLNRRFLISLTVLGISYFYFNVFYEVSKQIDPARFENTISVLSYNVRLFNAYEEEFHGDVPAMMAAVLNEKKPDVLCIQEYYIPNSIDFSDYPHRYIHFINKKTRLGHAIFSKYPLINTGAFDFSDSFNNTLYADVVKDKDTLRVYNLHLQSLGILPRFQFLKETDNDRLRRRLSRNFKKQENQIRAILEHKTGTRHPVIISGDFNNTPFSYTYRKLNKEMTDSFRERGNGLGTTFLFDSFPMRIDYILASKELKVLSFETLPDSFSDHNAVWAMMGW